MNRRIKNILWILPSLVIIVAVVYIPLFQGVYYMFTDYDGLSSSYKFSGFENIIRLYRDSAFWYSLFITFLYAFLSVVLINLCSMVFAHMLSKVMFFRNMLRVLLLMPNMIGGLILGFMWQYIFGTLLSQIPLLGHKISWLGNGNSAFFATVIVFSWQYVGYFTMIYLAALLNIPLELIDAAKIEGCSEKNLFRKFKIRLIWGDVYLAVLLSFFISFKTYDINLALTNGGPYGQTELISLNVYNEAYTYSNFSYAQTKAFFFMVILCGAIILWGNRKKRWDAV